MLFVMPARNRGDSWGWRDRRSRRRKEECCHSPRSGSRLVASVAPEAIGPESEEKIENDSKHDGPEQCSYYGGTRIELRGFQCLHDKDTVQCRSTVECERRRTTGPQFTCTSSRAGSAYASCRCSGSRNAFAGWYLCRAHCNDRWQISRPRCPRQPSRQSRLAQQGISGARQEQGRRDQ
jgi:hypothetical protein